MAIEVARDWTQNTKYAPSGSVKMRLIRQHDTKDPRTDELTIAREWKRRLQQEVDRLEADEERIRRLEALRDLRLGGYDAPPTD